MAVSLFVGFFTSIAALGFDGIVVHELVEDDGRRDGCKTMYEGYLEK